MMDKGIALAIVNIAIFLEFSGDEVINEDASVEGLEQLAADLQLVDQQSRADLSAHFRALSTGYKGDVREFVFSLPEAFGLE